MSNKIIIAIVGSVVVIAIGGALLTYHHFVAPAQPNVPTSTITSDTTSTIVPGPANTDDSNTSLTNDIKGVSVQINTLTTISAPTDQTGLESIANTINGIVGALSVIGTKLQTRTTAEEPANKNVVALQKVLVNKVSDAATQASIVRGHAEVTPGVLQTARIDVIIAIQDLRTAQSSAAEILQTLKTQ